MDRLQLLFVLLVLLQTAESFIFKSQDDDKNLSTFMEPVMEARVLETDHVGGWFGLFSRRKNESKENVIEKEENLPETDQVGWWFRLFSRRKNESKENVTEKEENLPVLSNGWMNKYRVMINQLSKMKSVLKESTLSKDLFNKYNSSMMNLMDIKKTLEETFDSEVVERYNYTLQSIDQGRKVFLSYNWYEKYSEALGTLDEIKTSIDNSLINEFKDIINTLTGVKNSWEQFSFYKLWQEQYKTMANINSLIINYWVKTNRTNGNLLASWKAALPKIASYQDLIKQYLPSFEKAEPVCTSKVFTCPDNK
jgi:hypothetical protein